MSLLKGQRPDLTPAQITAIVAAVVQFLRAFGVYDISAEQQEALNVACALLAAVVFGDAGLRAARNLKDAKVEATMIATGNAEAITDPALVGLDDLPDDDEEFASPPPDETNVPVQPSQAGIVDPKST